MSKREIVYVFYENETFSSKYAKTKYEAKKYCRNEARRRLKELDPLSTQKKPLWLGETPSVDGYYMLYGKPGPDKSLIFIQRFQTISGWFGGKRPEIDKIYEIHFKEIERVGFEFAKPPPPPSQIVKSSVQEVQRIRDLTVPRDQMLFAIEGGIRLRPTGKKICEESDGNND
jgi:hypothetical protein